MKYWLSVILLLGGTALAADGPALYKQHCARCHGETGQANNWRGILFFARDFNSQRWQAAHDDADILEAIERGPRIMPSYRKTLTEEERRALVQVVRGFNPQK